ncbi:MAG: nucleotidyltransferase family protein [Thermodesulfobacteriota bacterium]
MDAVILAGGFGTRLGSIVKNVPKPMADVNGRPFLCFLLDYLLREGVSKAILSVGYKHEAVRNYFGTGYNGLALEYAVESEPLGTGGAIRKAMKSVDGNDFFVLNGDSFFDASLAKLAEFHRSKGGALTLALKRMENFDRYGAVIVEDAAVAGFNEKTFVRSGYINAGVYCVNKAIGYAFEKFRYATRFSFETDFLQEKFREIKINAFICGGYFIDIGIPEDFERAKTEMKSFHVGAC